jgi:hypothetical protein
MKTQTQITSIIEQTYVQNNLLYIRFDGKIIKKPGGKKKIDGRRPAFSQITEQPKYNKYSGRYYSLLTGREYQPGRFLMLLDIDNKEEPGTRNGIEFMNLLNLDQYKAPKQQTPSGGFHYLFYADEAQKDRIGSPTTLLYEGKVYNVDVKFKNSLCNCEPSKIDNYGEYKWLNPEQLGDIPKLPEILFNVIAKKPAPKPKSQGNPLGPQSKIMKTPGPQKPDPTPTDPDDALRLCSCLPVKWLDNYTNWIKLGLCLKRIGCPVSIWEQVSKRSRKYRANDCSSRWHQMNPMSLGIGSLHHWAKQENPEEYDKIRPDLKSLSDIFADDQTHESVEINTRYLTPKDEQPTEDQRKAKEVIEHFQTDDIKTLFVKSAYGTGKTYMLQQLMMDPEKYKRVLFITYRQTLARDIDRNFKKLGFKNYLDGNAWGADKLIVQYDSLLKIMNTEETWLTGAFKGKYDMIVLDEVESLLMHMDGETMKAKEIQTFNFFDALLKLAGKVVCLDGDMSNRALTFLAGYGPYRYIKNNFQDTSKNIRIVLDEAKWNETVRKDIARFYTEDRNFKICICCQAASRVEALRKSLAEEHPELKILTLIGDDSGKTKRESLEDINETLKDVNVFVYSPVVESGVDITIKMKKVYGALSAGSNSQRAYLQMLARCRNVEEGEIPILNDPSFKVNRNYWFWTFKELEAMNREMVTSTAFSYEIVGDEIRPAAPKDVKRKTISIYNEAENLNKNPSVFLNYFRKLALEKGYGFAIDQANEGDKIERPENLKAATIVEAPDIDDEEFEKLDRLRKLGKTTREENYTVEKHYQQQLLETATLDPKQLKHFLNNRCALDYFLALIDLGNHRTEDTRKDIHLVEKVALVRDLVKALGFSSVVDEGRIEQDTFMMNFVMNVLESPRFGDTKRINELFGLSKRSKPGVDMTARRMANWVSRIMKPFSLELRVEKGSGDMYISPLGDIVNLVRRKNERGRYFEDEGDVLKLLRRPAANMFDTSGLDVDVFVDEDDEPQEAVQEQVVSEEPVVNASRFVPECWDCW